MDGIGYDVDIEFVDSCKCGNYHFVGDPPMKPTLRLPWLRYCY